MTNIDKKKTELVAIPQIESNLAKFIGRTTATAEVRRK